MADVTIAYVNCPHCGDRINLFHMKDFESYSKIEVERHHRARHPGVVRHGVMPYHPIKFETVQTER